MSAVEPEALASSSIAADLADLIYERWLAAGNAGYTGDHAGIEALCVLSECLRDYAADPKGSEATMQIAARILAQLPERPPRGEFQARILTALRRRTSP
jgi:hypothetical protein